MITGEYRVALDDKGRLAIPMRIRTEIAGDTLVLTRGIDRCLWLFHPEEWRKISHSILTQTSMFQAQGRMIQRRILAPAVEVEVDKTGRITIPPLLREHAGLRKDCLVLGMIKYLEIWDEEAYQEYQQATEASLGELSDQIAIMWPKE